MESTHEIGNELENAAARYLQARGLQVLGRQLRFRRGEIDLLMADREAIVFVEVRYRRHIKLGDGAESVDWKKREKMKWAAAALLAQRPEWSDRPCRFDVVSAQGPRDSPQWSWYRDAFRLQ